MSSQPLDQVTSVKVKLGLLVAASVTVAAVVAAIGRGRRSAVLAEHPGHGRAGPRRHPAARRRHDLAAARDDRGRPADGARRLLRPGHARPRSDEVGELARAFNRMAEDLAAVDRQRRELVANVSHELRTPLAALCAVLENLVDGVAEPDPVALRTALDQAERLGRPGRRPARPGPRRRRQGAAGTASRSPVGDAARPTPSPRPGCTGREVTYDVRVTPPDLDRARRPGPAAPAGRQPARQRLPAQSRRRGGPGHAPGSDRPAGGSRSPTRGRASPPPTGTASSSGSARSATPRAAAAPASASPSPAG